jgi:hypothetical protein
MTTKTKQTLCAVAGVAWLAIAGYGTRETRVDEGDGWKGPYLVFNLALAVGAVLVVVAAEWSSRPARRAGLRRAGLVVCALGAATTILAWALPLWMFVLGLGLAIVAAATNSVERRTLALLAVGQFAGLATLIACSAAEVGERDSYGDYPAAGGIALIVTAVITMLALVELARHPESAATPRHGSLDPSGAAGV